MVNYSVTVVIVNYNSGEMLVNCINQVLASTVPTRIIISDNASTDNSLHLVETAFKSNADVTIHRNNANRGFSAGNNAVYADITTPYILYLNPDCFIETNTIEQLINTMNEFPDAGMVGCLVTNTDGTEQAGCRGLTPTPSRVFNQMFKLAKLFPDNPKCSGYLLSDKQLPNQPIEVELISGSCMFVRKEAIEQVGLLDDNYFLYCEDYDWFYRFLAGNWKIIFNPRIIVMHIKSFSTRQIPLKVLGYKARGMWRYHNKFFKRNSSRVTTLVVRTGIISRLLLLGSIVLVKKSWKKIFGILNRVS
ncbi:glycosyltransferase family 2 protein [Legionella quateirensis]|uniref:Glycosyl transferase family protein n=1 Tax=Legionella quateirensis TaxID=45072 RepID=A0A378KYD5_9GAMM|nr:glycosyltransferase family 2 protein [Legionella quateirensis]KTD47624.1 glycosyl transferase family protein [Legionella quateirensis]STY18621.1 glycosyl transferase family protein [Legionella quateirensis]